MCHTGKRRGADIAFSLRPPKNTRGTQAMLRFASVHCLITIALLGAISTVSAM